MAGTTGGPSRGEPLFPLDLAKGRGSFEAQNGRSEFFVCRAEFGQVHETGAQFHFETPVRGIATGASFQISD